MANLNPKSGKHARVNVEYAPGVFQKNGQSITVTDYAQVEALISKGWVRTADQFVKNAIS